MNLPLCAACSLSWIPFLAPASPAGQGQPLQRELAGHSLTQFPFFQFTRSVNQGEPIQIAFDPRTDVGLGKRTLNVYVIDHADLAQALAGKKLAGLAPPLTLHLLGGGVKENTFLLNAGTLDGTGHADANGTWLLGHGYDVLVDMDLDGVLDGGDLLDGSTEEAGFHVIEDFVTFERGLETGPYPVTEVLFNAGPRFTRQDIFFPTDIAGMGELPLISISHGNGHKYIWYSHIGYLMASHGYVVMSHDNNTGPGIETASTSTLLNNDLFLANLDTIAGGALAGHVDSHRIVWIGHSRGGEGVVRAYRRLSEGSPLATRYTLDDIRLVSSMAPTDFLGKDVSDMGAAPYHLWTAGADADVNGCADCDLCQTFHLLERADGDRFSISLQGVGHGDLHEGGGSSVATGPCQVGRARTHEIQRGYLLPLVQFVLDDNRACQDFLTRQWEEFRPLGTSDISVGTNHCMVVDKMFLPGAARGRVMIDDFQSQPAIDRSSSGGAVQHSIGLENTLREGRYDDQNVSFTNSAVDTMNGMTLAGPGDSSAGAVLEWSSTDEWLLFEVPANFRDLGALRTLSFRAAQATRAPATVAELGDLDFAVELTDGARRSSVIRIAAYGGGIEEPYQRGGCGVGQGWANDFESIRIPLADFRSNGQPLDLTNIAAIRFLFGPSNGSRAGRIGLDEIEFTRE